MMQKTLQSAYGMINKFIWNLYICSCILAFSESLFPPIFELDSHQLFVFLFVKLQTKSKLFDRNVAPDS